MGSVRFTCACGAFRFLDSTDDRPYAAHFMPEQEWFPFLEAVDEAVEQAGPSPRERADACTALRARRSRQAFQCPECGALYLEDRLGEPHRFLPAAGTAPRDLFRPGPAPAGPAAVPGRPAATPDGRLETLRRLGEAAYDRMYEATSATAAAGCYSDAKEAFHDAVRAARELGLEAEAQTLEARLEHIKAVFRSQFS
jgi:hypothetical protein